MKSYSNVLGPDPRFGEGGQAGQWSFVSNNSASMVQRNQILVNSPDSVGHTFIARSVKLLALPSAINANNYILPKLKREG